MAQISQDIPLPFRSKRILVTGGTGFIGSHLVQALLSAGARVTVVDIEPPDQTSDPSSSVSEFEYVRHDVATPSFSLFIEESDFDCIFHLAGNPYVPYSVEHPWEDFESNILGSMRLFESLRKCKSPARAIVMSSAAVYGEMDSALIREDDLAIPISPYGASKLAIERYAFVYSRLYGLRIASLRLFSAYGPGQRKQVVYDFIEKLSQKPSHINALGDGTQVRDFSYVTDVVASALITASYGALRGETYNVGTGVGHTIQELLTILCQLIGISPSIHWSGTKQPGYPQHYLADASRLKSLGWQPIVPFAEGLQLTLAWYFSTFKQFLS